MRRLFAIFLWTVCLTSAVGQDTISTVVDDTVAVEDVAVEKKHKTDLLRPFKWTLGIMDKVSSFLMGCDTNYITPQLYEFSAQAELSYFHDYYRISSTAGDKNTHMTLQTGNPMTLGGYIFWGPFGFGRTWTLGKGTNANYRNSYTLNTARFVAEIYTFESGNTTKFTDISGIDLNNHDTSFSGLRSTCFGLNAQYIFNHKRYSWPAAFAENAVQKKSAGSWIAGFSYDHIEIDFDRNEVPDYIISKIDTTLLFSRVSYHDYGFSFGYNYNWPFCRNCLLAVSVLPSIGYRRSNVDSPESFILNNLTTDLFFRASLFWNNTKYFSGIVLDIHTYSYREKKFGLTNSYGTVKYILGLNFIKSGTKKK